MGDDTDVPDNKHIILKITIFQPISKQAIRTMQVTHATTRKWNRKCVNFDRLSMSNQLRYKKLKTMLYYIKKNNTEGHAYVQA